MPARRGEPLNISASVWNRLERSVPPPGGNEQLSSPEKGPAWRNIVYVRNSTGGNRDRGDVAGYVTPYFIVQNKNDSQPFLNPILTAIPPVWPDHNERFCVFIEPVVAGEVGRAVIDGIAWAKISKGPDDNATGGFAKVDSGAFHLLRNPCLGVTLIGEPSAKVGEVLGFGMVHLGRGEVGYPANEIEVQIETTIKSTDTTSTGEYIRSRSTYPFVDEPEGINETTGEVEFQNPFKLDAMCGAKVTLQRKMIEGCNETLEWVLIHSDKKKARWIKFTFTPGVLDSVVITDYYEGDDPTPCGTIDVVWPLGDPCEECPVIAFYDPNTDKYVAVDTEASVLGIPQTVNIIEAIAFDGCSINYIKTGASVFCKGDPDLLTTSPALMTTTVLANVVLRQPVEECPNVCRYEWSVDAWFLVESCGSGSGCACTADAPTDAPGPGDPTVIEFPCTRDDGLTTGPGGLDFYYKSIDVCNYVDASGIYTIPINECPPEGYPYP